MKQVFYLKTCSTCSRILSELDLTGFERIEIKSQGISLAHLEELKNLSGSYQSLFSKKAMKYRSMGLNERNLSEEDYKTYLLEEYTFLKRPVFRVEDEVFIGNSKKEIEKVAAKIQTLKK